MRKDSSQTLKGNDRFEGFGIDLIHDISVMLGFNYTFELQLNSKYGSFDNITGKWDGMIAELLEWVCFLPSLKYIFIIILIIIYIIYIISVRPLRIGSIYF